MSKYNNKNNLYILCSQCDMMVVLPKLECKHKALCPRCGTTLKIVWNVPKHLPTTYALAALIMLPLSNLFPFINIEILGVISKVKLLEIPRIMFSENYVSLSAFFLLFVQLIPTFCLITILLLVNCSKIPLAIKIMLARILFQLKNWGMAEIFLAGVLISFVKLASYGNISIGSSFIPWCLYCILQIRTFQFIDKCWIWDNIISAPNITKKIQAGISGIHQGLRSCTCCTAILLVDQLICPRCQTKGQLRRKNSLQWTITLLIISTIFYLLANIFPIMKTDLLGDKNSLTILTGIILLWKEGSYSIAVIIFIASIIAPMLKVIAIAWLCWNANGYGKYDSEYVYLVYEAVKFIGRWSMVDIFVISVLSALVHMGNFINIYLATGALMFTLVVIFTMFAAITFDPRLTWDRELKLQSRD